MPRMGITFADVMSAAEQIQIEGTQPTIEKIRQILGAGSNTTISKYLNQWKEEIAEVEHKEIKLLPPDIMRNAIERTWGQLRQEADHEIDKIKKEAEKRVNVAEERAQEADNNLQDLKKEHTKLQESTQTEVAEKELLLLDLKSIREEHHLLQERYKGLDERYCEMQTLTSQHLKDLTDAHQHEIANLKEQSSGKEESYKKLIDEIKVLHEQERQQHIVTIDNLMVERQKQLKAKDALQTHLQEQALKVSKLSADLSAMKAKHDAALTQVTDNEEKWCVIHEKSLVADAALQKIIDLPTLDVMNDKFTTIFTEFWDKKFDEFKASFKSIKRLKADENE